MLGARLAEQRDEVVLLLADPGVPDREDLEQPDELGPRRRGFERQLPDPVAEEAEGQRALAVLVGVDDLVCEPELEGPNRQVKRSVRVQDVAGLLPVLADQLADDLVGGIVEGEAPGRLGEGEKGVVGGGGVGAPHQPAMLAGGLRLELVFGLRRGRLRIRGHLY